MVLILTDTKLILFQMTDTFSRSLILTDKLFLPIYLSKDKKISLIDFDRHFTISISLDRQIHSKQYIWQTVFKLHCIWQTIFKYQFTWQTNFAHYCNWQTIIIEPLHLTDKCNMLHLHLTDSFDTPLQLPDNICWPLQLTDTWYCLPFLLTDRFCPLLNLTDSFCLPFHMTDICSF